MAAYDLLSSVQTVKVLSPTLVVPVLQCTIATSPSNVIATLSVSINSTGIASEANPELKAFAEAIEQIMARTDVIAGQGSESIDPNGLLTENVVFTVEYVSPVSTGPGITAEAVVPAASLNFSDGLIGATLLESVLAIIEGVYNSLQSAAAG